MGTKSVSPMARKLFTIEEASDYLGINTDEMREIIDTSRIPYGIFRDHVLLSEDDVEEYHQYLKLQTRIETIEDEPFSLTRQLVPPETLAALKTKPAQSETGFVYFLKYQGHYKIGKAMNVGKRVKTLGVQMPELYELIHTIEARNPLQAESIMKKYFAPKRLRGEWFALDDADIQWIKSLKRVTFELALDADVSEA